MRVSRDVDVIIAGAGPTGLMLACELALAGVRTVLLEKLPERPDFCRAFNLNVRSLELLDRRGLVERFLAEGPTRPVTSFGGLDTPLSLATLESDRAYTLGIPQTRTEALLETRARELGVAVLWGHELTGLEQDDDGVTVEVRTPRGTESLRAAYVAGCDGGRSAVRKLAGIPFPGTAATQFALLGDVSLGESAGLPFGQTRTPAGSVFVIPRPGYVRVIVGEDNPPDDRDAPVSLDELRAAVRRVIGREVMLENPRWLTRFGDAARQAERYRSGRILLAGDAAHIHPPAGAQGLNVGLQDAFNLGWKLAAEVRGWAPPGLLDTYHTERHAAAKRVLLNTRAQLALANPDERFDPLRALFAELAEFKNVHQLLAEMVTGAGTRYETRPLIDHPRAGRLVPNLQLRTSAGPQKVADLLHSGRAVHIDLTGRADLQAAAGGWSDRVDVIAARSDERLDFDAVLIRPDGYAAWLNPTGTSASADALRDSLTTWFGAGRDSAA